MELKEALEEIRTKPAVDLWPVVGLVFGLSRGAVYAAARNGDFATIRMGHRIKAVTSSLRKQLGIDAA